MSMIFINCQNMDLIELFKRSFWPIFPYLSILFNSNEVLPIFIAPCIFSGAVAIEEYLYIYMYFALARYYFRHTRSAKPAYLAIETALSL